MPRLTRIAGIAVCLIFPALCCLADDKPRVTLTVSKRTIGQPTLKTATGVENGRAQTLSVLVENSSSRPLPEGLLRWTAVVRKLSGGSFKYSGTEVVKPLRSFQSAEIQCGPFEIDSRPSVMTTIIERDRIDYELVLLHNEKESARTISVSNFAALAEKAEPMPGAAGLAAPFAPRNPDFPPRRKRDDEKPAQPAIIGAEKMPPVKPAIPVAEIAKPANEPPPVPQQKFDFFNLGGKTAPK